jgi:hypothetical protein
MHDDMRRLVDDDEVAILVDDSERHRFAGRRSGLRLRHVHGEHLTRFDPVGTVFYGRAGGTGDVARAEARARLIGDPLGEELVETRTGVVRPYRQRNRVRRHRVSPTGLRMASATPGGVSMQATDAVAAPHAPETVAPRPGSEVRLQRNLKLVVFGLGFLIFAGLAAIVGRVIYLASGPATQPAAPMPAGLHSEACKSRRARRFARSRSRQPARALRGGRASGIADRSENRPHHRQRGGAQRGPSE